MGFIYVPVGRAGEYNKLAVNMFKGCTHKCAYCYVPLATHTRRENFHQGVIPRAAVVEGIKKEAPKYRGRIVFMCFSCDPYPADDPLKLTREAIRIFHENEVGVRILTKAGMRATRDVDLLRQRSDLSEFGVTLKFNNEADSKVWEPKAAVPAERIESLKMAHSMGIPTWVSLEPVIVPEQTLDLIRMTHRFVDIYRIGKLNYDVRAKRIDWHSFVHEAVKVCEQYGKEYYLKKDLEAFW